jgi:thiol-disulfide isomerase/thioredoxin
MNTDTQTGLPMLVGECTAQNLTDNAVFNSWFTPAYLEYKSNSDLVSKIGSLGSNSKVLVFMGTWCGDTKRELPRFFRIIDEAKIPRENVTMYAVDRAKKTTVDLPEKYGITNVPTFIFMAGDKEIGRIVESPKKSLEEDIAEILGKMSR